MRSSFFLTIAIFFLFTTASFAQMEAYVQMDFEGPIQYVVTDSQGKRSGCNPMTNTDYDEIPYAGYGDMGEGGRSAWEFGFRTALEDTLFSTTYTIRFFGTGNGVFRGGGGGQQTWSGKGASFRVLGVIDSNQTVTYVFNYSTDSTITPTFWKVVTPQIIRQDLDNCHKLPMIKDAQLYSNLGNILTVFQQDLAKADSVSARQEIILFQQTLRSDSATLIHTYAWNILQEDAKAFLATLPSGPSPFIVKLVNSTGTRLTTGSLQYYEGSWKDATNNNDGTFTINSTAKTLSLRMTYEYGTQTKSNVTVGTDTAVFQTVNAQIKLQDSRGNPIDTGTVQYYAGAWRNLGTTINGVATKELLQNNYSFRMTYAYGSNDKAQDIGANATVVFQTVNAMIQLQNSQGSLIDTGAVQYYAGAWRTFGTTSNGVTTKELLPNNYSFRMTYAYGSNDKQQNIGTNPTVVFQTVNATVQLKNSQGNLFDQGTVQYYAGAWRSFGTTSGGVAAKELLSANYTFRMTYESVSNDKAQDISTNSTVAFSTVLCTISVKDSQGQPVNNVQASYYSGAWRQIGSTVNGQVTKELLPANLTFRITYGTNHQDKTQNLATNSHVEFTTQ